MTVVPPKCNVTDRGSESLSCEREIMTSGFRRDEIEDAFTDEGLLRYTSQPVPHAMKEKKVLTEMGGFFLNTTFSSFEVTLQQTFQTAAMAGYVTIENHIPATFSFQSANS